MMLLAVDTSTSQMGLALSDAGQVAAETIWYSRQHHTVELAPALAELLKHASLSMEAVEGLVVATGPGSFTALRVGLALVKGLAIARNLPVVGVPTLDILAAGQVPSAFPLAAVLQAGRGRIAVAWYRPVSTRGPASVNAVGGGEGGWELQAAADITSVDSLAKSIDKPTLVAGELTSEERQRLARKKVNVVLAPPTMCVRRPAVLAELGRQKHERRRPDDLAALAPVYLHLTDAIHA